MTESLLESLLHQGESTTLDFKEGQYAFVKAADEEKSEILKDILAFANAWRASASRARCLAIACRVTGSRPASVVAVAAPAVTSSSKSRRLVGSAIAASTPAGSGAGRSVTRPRSRARCQAAA